MNSLKPKNKSTSKANNFLEAFKEQTKAATFGVAAGAYDQIIGRDPQAVEETKPQTTFNFEEYLRSRENQIRNQERLIARNRQVTETLVFHRKEEAAHQQIEYIKSEIKTLVVQTGKLSGELVQAEKAVMGQTPDIQSGTYYLSFFERIKRLVILAKKKINESRTWLAAFNGRCQNKSYYWSQFAKSGSKFSLSHERYMATQAG